MGLQFIRHETGCRADNLGLCVWMGGFAEQLCWLSLRTEGGMEVIEKLGYSCALHRVTPRLSLRAIRCVTAIN